MSINTEANRVAKNLQTFNKECPKLNDIKQHDQLEKIEERVGKLSAHIPKDLQRAVDSLDKSFHKKSIGKLLKNAWHTVFARFFKKTNACKAHNKVLVQNIRQAIRDRRKDAERLSSLKSEFSDAYMQGAFKDAVFTTKPQDRREAITNLCKKFAAPGSFSLLDKEQTVSKELKAELLRVREHVQNLHNETKDNTQKKALKECLDNLDIIKNNMQTFEESWVAKNYPHREEGIVRQEDSYFLGDVGKDNKDKAKIADTQNTQIKNYIKRGKNLTINGSKIESKSLEEVRGNLLDQIKKLKPETKKQLGIANEDSKLAEIFEKRLANQLIYLCTQNTSNVGIMSAGKLSQNPVYNSKIIISDDFVGMEIDGKAKGARDILTNPGESAPKEFGAFRITAKVNLLEDPELLDGVKVNLHFKENPNPESETDIDEEPILELNDGF